MYIYVYVYIYIYIYIHTILGIKQYKQSTASGAGEKFLGGFKGSTTKCQFEQFFLFSFFFFVLFYAFRFSFSFYVCLFMFSWCFYFATEVRH